MAATEVPTGNTYDKYSSTHRIEQKLMDAFFQHLDAALPVASVRSILEVGVGEAIVARRVQAQYPRARLVGLDLPDPALALHWAEGGVRGVFADIHHLPFPDASFDLVLGIEVLEHVADPVAAVHELSRIASGHLVVSVPREPIWRLANLARGKYIGALGNTPGHINHWSTRNFVGLIEQKFTVASVTTPFPWTMVSATSQP